jgi:hypothetical protein
LLSAFLLLSAPILDKLVHLDVYAEPLLAHGRVDALELGRVHLADQGAEGLHEDGFGPGAGLDGAVEDGLGLGAQLPARVAETDVRDPEPHVVSADVRGQGALEGRPRRVRVPRAQLVRDGEDVAAEGFVGARQDVFVK